MPNIILIVDDEPLGRSSLQGLLAKEGYRLEFAADGPTALKMAKEILPDLVLLDVMLPGMDGYAVTRELRATPALAEVPILLLTALDGPESRLAGIEAGADDFISKPFDRAELRARVRSITRLNRFRRLLHEREKHRLLFERSPCGLLMINNELRIVECNSLAQRILDLVPGATTPQTILHLIPPGGADRFVQLLHEAKHDPNATPHAEFISRSRSGTPVWIEMIVGAFPPGGHDACLVALRDVTPERQLEAEYRHAQKIESVGQLASGVAHDFNNLLTVINGFSELIMSRLEDKDPVRALLEQIHQAGELAASLTRQLLAFSRKQVLCLVELDLNSLIGDIQKMLRRLIGEDMIVQTVLSPNLGRIKADPGQVEQILINLAVNGRDAMTSGGMLTISTREVDGELAGIRCRFVRLTVADTGCGMSPEVLARIFEPFFTTKEAGKGTGLGLATVYSIVKQAGGRIEVFTEPSRGTRIEIDFPRLTETVDAPKPTSSYFLTSKGSETVLLAEDEESVRSYARLALESAGYKVLEATDGEHALQISRQFEGNIHLLLTDVVMPRRNGRQLAETLRQERPNVRILYVSGYTDETIFRGGLLDADDAFLQKPYTPQLIRNKVREVLDR